MGKKIKIKTRTDFARARMRIRTKLEGHIALIKVLQGELIEEVTDRIYRSAVANCPVDTGRLRASIYKVVERIALSGRVITDSTHYAWFVELGTRYMAPRAFMRNALREHLEYFKREMRRIPKRAEARLLR